METVGMVYLLCNRAAAALGLWRRWPKLVHGARLVHRASRQIETT